MHTQGYRNGCIDGISLYAHRVAWALYFGEWPDGEIDHINHDHADNRICNLRSVTRAENLRNLPKMRHNTSGVTGVYRRKDKWLAAIRVDRKLIRLGYFHSFNDAVAARELAERQYRFHPNHGRNAA